MRLICCYRDSGTCPSGDSYCSRCVESGTSNSLALPTERKHRAPSILNKLPGCCEGNGKLKDFQLKIPSRPFLR